MKANLDMLSADLMGEKIKQLRSIFPNCVTETAEGSAVDFDLLKQELAQQVVSESKERYRFEWPGKREAIVNSNLPTTKTLRPVREDSSNFDDTENLYIEGDNLEVLKLLQESYLSKIKLIYIDPPYNTGNDFVYNDSFEQSSADFKEASGIINETKQQLLSNPQTSGRYHSNWLSMLYPRLKLARNLLTDEGVIFISIDDNEVHNLRKLCDDVFGETNFVCQFVWSGGRKNDSKLVSISHEYIICYLKSKETLNENKVVWREKKQGLDEIYSAYNKFKQKNGNDYKAIQNELKSWFKNLPPSHPARNHSHYSSVDERGIYFPDNVSWPGGGGPKYEVMHPVTNRPVKIPSRGWLFSNPDKMTEMIKDQRIHFGEDENSVPCMKSYLKDREHSVPYSVFYKDGRASTKRLMTLLGGALFENPKDEEIIKSILEFAGTKDSIILDFFSGSATTAHAVMQLNSEDNGNRKFILVQLQEEVDEKSLAYQSGYKNICEIGKERIRRASKKIMDETKADIDYGFRVYRLDDSNMQDVYYRPQDYAQDNLELFADNVKPGRTSDDLLAQVMLDWGLPLSLKIEQLAINDKQVLRVAENSLMACFDNGIDEKFAKEIATHRPLRVVFRDASFKDDTAKENVKQLLKQLSPDTEMRVI